MFGTPRVLIDADYWRIGAHLISPFDSKQVQPASYDVTLGRRLLFPKYNPYPSTRPRIDLRITKPADLMVAEDMLDSGMILQPRECVLGATAEKVTCPADMICSVDGKSTLGRCWIAIHATAGFIDPGFHGVVTLEITNHGPWSFVVYPGMRIGQLRFHWLGQSVVRPYGSPGLGSHYQDSESVKAAEP